MMVLQSSSQVTTLACSAIQYALHLLVSQNGVDDLRVGEDTGIVSLLCLMVTLDAFANDAT
jgi:hypothetical protein